MVTLKLVLTFATCASSCVTAFLPPARQSLPKHFTSNTECELLVGVLGGVAVVGLVKSVKIVQEADVAIIERLGKFHKQLNPGLHLTIPFIDRMRSSVTQREQVFDIPPQKCITSDNAPLSADAVVYWRIFDPKKAVYSVVDLNLAIQNLVLTELRSEIGKLTLDMTFSARERINAVILDDLDLATDPWGVKITRVEVRDIIPESAILSAMEQQMAAERTKRATVIKSEGERERAINAADGESQARLIDAKADSQAVLIKAKAEATRVELEAQGVKKALDVLNSAFDTPQDAARFQIMQSYIDAQLQLAKSSNTKVILASDNANEVLSKAVAFYETKD